VILWQLFVKAEQIIKAFHQMIISGVRSKFKHWFFDFGFKNSVAVCLFSMSLFFSIIVPYFLLFSAVLFVLMYYFEKYNVIYIYPIDFESKPVNRKTLVVYSIVSVILFQLAMFIFAGSVLNKKINIYLFAYLVIQSMVVFTTFEFIRKPWVGRESEVEKALQQNANNIFESISSFTTDRLAADGSSFRDDFLAEGRQQDKNQSGQHQSLY